MHKRRSALAQRRAHLRPGAAELSGSVFRDLVEYAPDAIALVDAHGLIVLVNAETERLFGWRREDLLGRRVEVLIPERFQRRHIGHRADYAHARRMRPMGVGLELYGRRKDGSEFPVEVSLSPITTAHGTLVCSVIRDIQARREAEEALRKSQRDYEALVNSIDGIVWELDAETFEFRFVSQRAESLLGYPLSSWFETPNAWVKYLHPEDRDSALEYCLAETRARRDHIFEYRMLTADGQTLWLQDRVSVVVEDDGHVILRGVIVDITRRKEAEDMLVHQARELARSNEQLEQFAYVASHDLQEPLRTVASYTQLLVQRYGDQLDADAREFMHFALDAVHHMHDLIQDLLAYSRLNRAAQVFAPTDLNAALDAALINLGQAIDSSGAVVEHEPLPTVEGDAIQLVQLFQNLVGNAIKYRGPDTPRVQVSVERRDDEWCISVRDNGIGIDPQHAARIFALFQRLHRRDEYPGSGIGLAICKRIVERHGGRIWVEAGNPGSVFRFTLPVRQGSQGPR